MSNKSFWTSVYYVSIVLLTVAYMGRGIGTPNGTALHAVEAHGFTDARIVDRSDFWSWVNGCDAGDATAWTVTAKRDGRTVRLYVCSGAWTKGATVRVAP